MTLSSHSASDWRPVVVARAEYASIKAGAGRSYRVAVSVPEGAAPPGGYPSLIVLDGAALFATVAETERRLSHRPGATGATPMVVIGVSHDDDRLYDAAQRHRDYTPGPSTEPGVSAVETGGADAFIDVLLNDVIPVAGERVALDPTRRALLGHSLAGYFALHVLTRRPEAFNAYAAISPSLWWNPAPVLSGLADLRTSAPRLFTAVGALEQPDEDTPRARRGMVDGTRRVAIQAARAGLDAPPCLVLPDEDHASVLAPAAARFLRFFSTARRP